MLDSKAITKKEYDAKKKMLLGLENTSNTVMDNTVYECNNCHFHFKGKQSKCPKCGAQFKW